MLHCNATLHIITYKKDKIDKRPKNYYAHWNATLQQQVTFFNYRMI